MARPLSEATRRTIIERIPNYAELLAEEAEAAIIRVIADDFFLFCERNLYIEDKITSEVIPLIDVVNWQQRQLLKVVLKDIADGKPVRYIILKARQMGLSTIIEALGYWWTITHRNIHTLIIAHDSDAAESLYEMFKRYFDYSHSHFQPTRKYNNKKQLVFDVEDKVKEEWTEHISMCREPETCGVSHKAPGLGSSIKTMVAKDGKGRSMKNHFFHGSEVAFWEAKADVVSAAIQTVPLAPKTFVFLESTANGVGGFFYDTWQSAKRGESNLKPLFFAWHEHEEYEIRGTCNDLYDEEETQLMEIFFEKNYDRERWDWKILWRREKKKEFIDDPKKFYQEYPKDDMEAFIASGRPRFDTKMLIRMEEYAIKKGAYKTGAYKYGQVVPNPNEDSRERYVFEEVSQIMDGTDPTPLKVWELPIKRQPGVDGPHYDAKYVIGVDVSEGKLNKESRKKENDYSVIDVMKASNLQTVARWRGHIDPDLLGGVVNSIGRFYNNALVGVEVNNHGLTTVQSLRNKSYPNLYMRENNEEHRFQERTSLMGWRTDKKTKKIIIDNLAQAIREGDIIDLDVIFIRECMTYIRDDQGYTNAQEGQFDDTVMAKAIALKLSDYESIDTTELKAKISKPVKRNKNATSSTNSDLTSIARPGAKRSSYAEAIARRRATRASHKAGRRIR
jgi:hypothetical protein